MKTTASAAKRVLVIGGGISGLAAAHRLRELDPQVEVTLLEASGRLGGVLQTVRREGFLIECAADNFITNVPWAVELCRRIGLEDQLIATSRGQRAAMVVHRGQLVRVPAGFMLMQPSQIGPVLTTPLLSLWGKLRLLGELFVPRRESTDDESLASFARRRLGREAYERIVQPLVGGIYTADPEKLSVRATLPRFLDMERQHGGLIRAALRGRYRGELGAPAGESGARYGLFVTLREGMASLIEAIAKRLPPGAIRLNTRVERVSRTASGGWSVRLAAENSEPLEADALVIAVGASQAARMLNEVDGELSNSLAGIEYAGTAIVTLAYRRDQIAHPLDSFGFVVPAVERRQILAGSFSSVKFPGRAPDDCVLVRVFLGGACQSELLALNDNSLRRIAREELAQLLGIRGEPLFDEIFRWTAMPQYHLGHCERVAQIEHAAARWGNLALAGNAYHGVGIPNCIHSGETAAERLHAALAGAAAS